MVFEITKIDVKSSKGLEITYKVTNHESFPVEIHTRDYQYFDDVAVKKDWSELQNPIAAGKSGICTVEFYGSTIKSTGISKIGTFTLEMYSEEESGATHLFEVIFENVNIDLE